MFRIVTTAAVVALGTAFAAQAQDDQQSDKQTGGQQQTQNQGQQQDQQAQGQQGEQQDQQAQGQQGDQQNQQAQGQQDQGQQSGQQQAQSGEQGDKQGQKQASKQGGMGVNAEAFRDFEDTAVRSEDGRDIGEIEQVLVNPENMEIAFTVETSEGFLDIGDNEKIVPMSELEYREDHFVTRMTEQEVEQLPTYDGS